MSTAGVIADKSKSLQVGLRASLIGVGGGVESALCLGNVTVGISDSLDDFLEKLRSEIEPLWNRSRHDAAMNGLRPDCTNRRNNCPCFFWSEDQHNGPLCPACTDYRSTLNRVLSGGV